MKTIDIDKNTILQNGKNVIINEAEALQNLVNQIDENFFLSIKTILESKGKVVLSGMGKSGLIARKIAATMNSTGTNAIFLHPSDAVHGDLGAVNSEDVVILISNSGNTEEVLNLVPILKKMGNKIISIVGNIHSKLAEVSDITLNLDIKEEACPYNLAPTSSTTATLALGDAIAIVLLQCKHFTPEDFAMYHPGGSLGKKLALYVSEIMKTGENIPKVSQNSKIKDIIYEISSKRLGVTTVTDENGKLLGVITDGDIRRAFEKFDSFDNIVASDIMSANPKTIKKDLLAHLALNQMEKYKITSLIVVNENNFPIGVVHMHDLIDLGLNNK
ncbi:MAG TPA: KpsF/GutQ family sugar-phosphate isomerase [Ignavibacteriales bacterium]|nr:KpsF/GutQ family sugar-phosphate isomerase [Ignavibacteriales bacterium]HOL81628.1 KpsF/GutQ family sugar-phosphate isomerase [Ignavibacteriales bacterium]HOM65191.1 KpsF/GutQ family sugar-phosphate isomerase [Ignavibacteriales bacterium]HPD66915.1 KpsF/GutQ family sugar-phosphate isomerase [Ignavibacteriales bacterium]HPP33742.1 KpsF/GutQ family sugar-phosphate isomerase [Ignavibacteriales bacterium]